MDSLLGDFKDFVDRFGLESGARAADFGLDALWRAAIGDAIFRNGPIPPSREEYAKLHADEEVWIDLDGKFRWRKKEQS